MISVTIVDVVVPTWWPLASLLVTILGCVLLSIAMLFRRLPRIVIAIIVFVLCLFNVERVIDEMTNLVFNGGNTPIIDIDAPDGMPPPADGSGS